MRQEEENWIWEAVLFCRGVYASQVVELTLGWGSGAPTFPLAHCEAAFVAAFSFSPHLLSSQTCLSFL